VMRFLFIFVKLTIESRNIELFPWVLTYSHHFDDFFYVERQP
jgi:hypothetical protein